MKNAQGYTLMELVLIIAIMGILMAFALPALGVFRSNASEKEAARQVFAALRNARILAISHNVEYQLAFDLDSSSYWLERGNRASNSATWTRICDYTGFASDTIMATGVNCTNISGDGNNGTADNKIQFNPNGTCGSSGTANARYICVMGSDGSKKFRSGVPSSSTGRAVIHRWNAGWK
ncbi:MAG: prepilin-type N-terminal cleavage/methylation domain-containing protein [Desulfuromonas sp.]|nr:prepilin-type N-terminal cleavage/methylation domain-containing protein [Desulfuromonas sp.]